MNRADRNKAFDHASRQYLIRCAKHALPLAPLPEFKTVLALLEMYDEQPTAGNRDRLAKAYRALKKGEKTSLRSYGYTAVGEFYWGLRHIVYLSLHPSGDLCSSSAQHFAEAKYCAGEHLGHAASRLEASVGQNALMREGEWQHEVYKETSDAYFAAVREAA